MNRKAINFMKNISYTITSNLVSLFVSTLVILIVPKLIGIEEYGYLQLYLFYSMYVGFLHFGWNDGIYLRYGGKEYKDLDKRLFFSQFYMMAILQLALMLIVVIIPLMLHMDSNREFIFQMIALCLFSVNLRFMLLYVLQSTNRIKEFAYTTVLDRILYSCLIVIFLTLNIRDYKVLIVADIIGKFISLFYAMYCCREIVFRKITTFYFSINEAFENISTGIKLMFATIAGMLNVGVIRFGIERSWDVSTFGKISLTLSISNLLMLFINAVGIIMFPILRRTDEKMLPSIYSTMRNILMVLLLGILILYYPFKVLLTTWLPQYSSSLIYMSILFPLCVFEGKMSLLVNTYLKTLRQERLMLRINLISLGLSIIVTFLTTVILRNLNLAIVSVVIVLAFRCVLSEKLLSKTIGISVNKDIALEITMTTIFILTGWYINSWLSLVLYTIAYVIYMVIKGKQMGGTLKHLKLLMGKQ